MTLSRLAKPFFFCISNTKTCKRNFFLCKAKERLSEFDFNLFSSILNEWETNVSLVSCFASWRKFVRTCENSNSSSLHLLSFNVRGLEQRWQDILLLISSLTLDIIVLLETGVIDLSFHEKIFSNFKLFYQKGENRNGGVLVLVRQVIQVSRITCKIPNVCVIDIKGDNELRTIGVYASESKTWTWEDLSPFISKKCVIYGDFNVDSMQDGKKAEVLLNWADDYYLAQIPPDTSTSLRSDRVIDYAFARGINIDIQTYKGNTTSDHLPIISVIPFQVNYQKLGKNVHWKVFSLFSEYTFSFWEVKWDLTSLDDTYNDYIQFLFLLSARCTTYFHPDKYRSAIPVELRIFW